MKIQAVLFDCDGVLLDSERKIKQQIHESLKNVENYNFSFDEFYKITRGMSIVDSKALLETYNIYVDDSFGALLLKLFTEDYKYIAEKMDNLDLMLENLKDFPKAVCSNGSVHYYCDALEHFGVKNHFNSFFGIETTKNTKPAPDMFLQAAESLNVDIANCLIIDDSYLTGVPAGVSSKAGAVVGFADEFTEDSMMFNAGADYVIRNLIELPTLINQINSKI